MEFHPAINKQRKWNLGFAFSPCHTAVSSRQHLQWASAPVAWFHVVPVSRPQSRKQHFDITIFWLARICERRFRKRKMRWNWMRINFYYISISHCCSEAKIRVGRGREMFWTELNKVELRYTRVTLRVSEIRAIATGSQLAPIVPPNPPQPHTRGECVFVCVLPVGWVCECDLYASEASELYDDAKQTLFLRMKWWVMAIRVMWIVWIGRDDGLGPRSWSGLAQPSTGALICWFEMARCVRHSKCQWRGNRHFLVGNTCHTNVHVITSASPHNLPLR